MSCARQLPPIPRPATACYSKLVALCGSKSAQPAPLPCSTSSTQHMAAGGLQAYRTPLLDKMQLGVGRFERPSDEKENCSPVAPLIGALPSPASMV